MTLILPTIDTTTGAGDTGKAGGSKVNAGFRALETLMPVPQATRIIIEGDSIAAAMAGASMASPLFWADARFPVSYVFDRSKDNFAIGSTNTSDQASPVGMTTTTRLSAIAARIAAVRAAGERVLCIIQAGTNDVGLTNYSDNSAPGTVANIQKMLANMFGAGASHVVIMSIDPRLDTTADQSRLVLAINAGLAELCRRLPEKLTFCDTQFATADDSTALFLPQGLAGAEGTHADTLHPAARGAYYKASVLGPILRRLLPHRRSLITPSSSFQSATSPASLRGNIIGKQGRFYDTGAGTAQTDGITVADTATVTGKTNLPSAKLFSNYPGFAAPLTGTMALEITQQPWPVAVTELGRTDIMCTRLRFSGIPTASGYFSAGMVQNGLGGYDVANGPYEAEILMYADKMKGLRGLGFSVAADGAGGQGNGDAIAAPSGSAKLLPIITGLLNFRMPTPLVAASKPSNVTLTMGFTWNAGYEVSGDMYLFGSGVFQNVTMVAPTA
jgi:lysophospholipase L1-like esterase